MVAVSLRPRDWMCVGPGQGSFCCCTSIFKLLLPRFSTGQCSVMFFFCPGWLGCFGPGRKKLSLAWRSCSSGLWTSLRQTEQLLFWKSGTPHWQEQSSLAPVQSPCEPSWERKNTETSAQLLHFCHDRSAVHCRGEEFDAG